MGGVTVIFEARPLVELLAPFGVELPTPSRATLLDLYRALVVLFRAAAEDPRRGEAASSAAVEVQRLLNRIPASVLLTEAAWFMESVGTALADVNHRDFGGWMSPIAARAAEADGI